MRTMQPLTENKFKKKKKHTHTHITLDKIVDILIYIILDKNEINKLFTKLQNIEY